MNSQRNIGITDMVTNMNHTQLVAIGLEALVKYLEIKKNKTN